MGQRFFKITLGCAAAAMAALSPMSVHALTDDIDAVNENGRTVETVTTDTDIYVSGICEAAEDTYVEAFVVDDRGSWKDETVLTDLSGSVESIKVGPDGEVPLTRVWPRETNEGEYDIVLDINGNKEYDEDEDCVAGRSGSAFQVINKGAGSVRLGSKNPDPDEELRWRVEKDEPFVTLLVLRVSADDLEDIRVTSVTVQARGTVRDNGSVEEVIIAEDRGSDGLYKDGRESVWGTGHYRGDNTELTLDTNAIVSAGTSKNVLVTYLMGADLSDDTTFQVNVSRIEGEGVLSGETIRFDGLPLRSVVAEVVGSGDAQAVERVVPSEPAEEKETKGADADTASFMQKFIPRGQQDTADDAERTSTPREGVPVWFQVTVFVALVIIGLVVLWKIARWIFLLFRE